MIQIFSRGEAWHGVSEDEAVRALDRPCSSLRSVRWESGSHSLEMSVHHGSRNRFFAKALVLTEVRQTKHRVLDCTSSYAASDVGLVGSTALLRDGITQPRMRTPDWMRNNAG